MKVLSILAAAALAMGISATANAQNSTLRVYTCDTTIASQPFLRIEDNASLGGALLEEPALITLPNGMQAVQFAVRYAKRLIPSDRILKVRYTVSWSDDCGRRLTNGANTLDGLALSPRQYQVIQSTAMDPAATRAVLHIYIDN
ncbi:hypothetical protein H0A65_04655 [Alcaligenaceae bacterium]|nr:hypothetical protein [Alcaligenaceae bacterium]